MGFINDGFSTTMDFANITSGTLYFQEVDLVPPGIDMGGPNDTTTMRNTTWRTMQPKQLKTLTESTLNCKYDSAIYDEILAALGTITQITLTFPDTSTLLFYGWIDKFIPGTVVEGEMATAAITVVPSNQTAAGAEIAPAYTGD